MKPIKQRTLDKCQIQARLAYQLGDESYNYWEEKSFDVSEEYQYILEGINMNENDKLIENEETDLNIISYINDEINNNNIDMNLLKAITRNNDLKLLKDIIKTQCSHLTIDFNSLSRSAIRRNYIHIIKYLLDENYIEYEWALDFSIDKNYPWMIDYLNLIQE